MTAFTPGRRAYEAWRGEDLASALAPPWAALGEGDRERWERAGWANDESDLRAGVEQARGEAARTRKIAEGWVREHDKQVAALREACADREELRVALANLTDRAEASQAITGDEADEYRKLTGPGGGDHA
jgi:hypothetical protein